MQILPKASDRPFLFALVRRDELHHLHCFASALSEMYAVTIECYLPESQDTPVNWHVTHS